MITRTLKLSTYGNSSKMESVRYTAQNYSRYVQHFITQLFFYSKKNLSTAGMGQLANQAQHKARGILRAQMEATKATGNKVNIPNIKFNCCPARIEPSKSPAFDYWVGVEDPFSRKLIRIPAKSHKRLNHFLREGWTLNPVGELNLQKNGKWQVHVYIQKEVAKAEPKANSLGVDVGITHAVARSDGYLGAGLRHVIKRSRLKDAERRRQGHSYSILKSSVKQQLDVEARRAVVRCKRDGLSLAVESPKRLANLRGGKLQGWARSYLANRASCIAEEEGVWFTYVNPAYSSQICYACGYRDKLSRVKLVFECTTCGNRTHADVNASRVIAQRARSISGSVIRGVL